MAAGYDTLGRLTGYGDGSGVTAALGYDVVGRLVRRDDGKAITSYGYDGPAERRGLLTSIVDAQAGTFTGGYDADGRLSTQTFPGGLQAAYGYDHAGGRVRLDYAKGGVSWATFTASRDRDGRVRRAASPAATVAYGYDPAGRLTGVVERVGQGRTLVQYHATPTQPKAASLTFWVENDELIIRAGGESLFYVPIGGEDALADVLSTVDAVAEGRLRETISQNRRGRVVRVQGQLVRRDGRVLNYSRSGLPALGRRSSTVRYSPW